MLSLTRKADYALVALVSLGHRWRCEDGPISARTLAQSFMLPAPLLMNTLKDLAQHGLVRAQRGATGGYVLAVDPATVTLRAVIRAVEGEPNPPAGADGADGVSHGRAVVDRLERQVFGYLDQLTLADLLDEPSGETPDRPPAEAPIPLRTAQLDQPDQTNQPDQPAPIAPAAPDRPTKGKTRRLATDTMQGHARNVHEHGKREDDLEKPG